MILVHGVTDVESLFSGGGKGSVKVPNKVVDVLLGFFRVNRWPTPQQIRITLHGVEFSHIMVFLGRQINIKRLNLVDFGQIFGFTVSFCVEDTARRSFQSVSPSS